MLLSLAVGAKTHQSWHLILAKSFKLDSVMEAYCLASLAHRDFFCIALLKVSVIFSDTETPNRKDFPIVASISSDFWTTDVKSTV